MRKLVIALALGLVPGLAFAQQGQRGPQAEMRGPMRGGHAAMLVEHRAALELTDEQVARLQAIAGSLEEKNAPYVAELQKLRGEEDTRPRDLPQAQRDAFRAAMDSMRENNRAARDEAQAILTEQQREKAAALMRERMRERRGEGMRGGRRGPGAGGPAQGARGGMRRGSL